MRQSLSNQSSSSLGGAEHRSRSGGSGSSPGAGTKSSLRKKIRTADKKIGLLTKEQRLLVFPRMLGLGWWSINPKRSREIDRRIAVWDEKRRVARVALKARAV